MKAKLIIAGWLISLMCMATDNIVQALIALCCFGAASLLLEKNKQEVKDEIQKLDKWCYKQIKKHSYK